MLEALFTSGIDEIKVSGLTQWDKGQKIHISCPDVSVLFEVHYTFKGSKEALVILPESDVAIIPDELLTQPNDLVAYVYALGGDGSGETVKTIDLPVSRRAKPVDYSGELTPSFMEQVEAMLASMEEKVENLTPEDINAADRTLSNLTDMQKALYNIGGRPRKNLIDNPRFKVNQRGKMSYTAVTTANLYTIDRWYLSKWYADNRVTLTVDSNGIVLAMTGDTATQRVLSQKLSEETTAAIEGKIITISYLTPNGALHYVSGSEASSFGSDLFYYDGSSKMVYFVCYGSVPTAIKAVKLEIGTQQTLAYQDSNGDWVLYEDYDYLQDLMECQRYLWLNFTESTTVQTSSLQIPSSVIAANSIFFYVPMPVTQVLGNPDIVGTIAVSNRQGSAISGFSFATQSFQNYVLVSATKTAHGLTDALLRVYSRSGFSSEL